MFARYVKTRLDSETTQYEFQSEVSIFGCNKGIVPWILGSKLQHNQEEPWKWHVDVVKELKESAKYPHNTLLIDLKPKQNKTNLSLYELMDVWGYSDNGWTPVLLRLNGLFVDERPSIANRNSFLRKDYEIKGPIYEFLYLDGSTSGGKLVGRWALPPMSPTNAPILWPETLRYFLQCMSEVTPEVIDI